MDIPENLTLQQRLRKSLKKSTIYTIWKQLIRSGRRIYKVTGIQEEARRRRQIARGTLRKENGLVTEA